MESATFCSFSVMVNKHGTVRLRGLKNVSDHVRNLPLRYSPQVQHAPDALHA